MTRRRRYSFVYARWVAGHLETIDSKYDSLMRDKIEEQLQFEPGVETKNRKPLRQPATFGAHWEIRFGPDNRFRVLYDIDEEQHSVAILAVCVKHGSRLIVGREEVRL
jgi:mRNA-degrading endonuclease RelE of RelBE toxin-antitoxin system